MYLFVDKINNTHLWHVLERILRMHSAKETFPILIVLNQTT